MNEGATLIKSTKKANITREVVIILIKKIKQLYHTGASK